MMDELKSRAVTLIQLAEEASFLVKSVPLDFSEAAQKLLDTDGKTALKAIADKFDTVEPFTHETIEEACRALATDLGLKLGKVMMPLRAALTGRDKSPSLFHAAEVLGKVETLKRIRAAAE
jgi:glutamyl-tRNA synthetase